MAEFYSGQLEKRVLSGLLHNEESLDLAIHLLEEEDFHIGVHRYLFCIISRFYQKFFKPISREILSKWLTKNDSARKSEILLLFGELSALPVDDYLRYYIDELTSLTARRRLYKIYGTIQTGLEDDIDPSDIYSEIATDILRGDASTNVSRKWIFEDTEQRIQDYIDRRDNPEKYRGVPYGIKAIDELTGGMYPQQLYLVIGRTAAGKSRYLFNIGCNAAKAGKNVMYITIEMDLKIIQQMWESREAKIPLSHILQQKLTPAEEQQYFEFLRNQPQLQHPFYVVDIPQGCTTGVIESEVATFIKIHGKPPDIVLADYASLIQPVSKYKDRAEKYDHVFRELKEMSRAHNTILYTAAQMNRESLKAKKTGTEHVAFSDAATHHCDAIFHIYADDKDKINHEVHLDVIKGRYHKEGSINLAWDRDTNHIRDWDDFVKHPTEAVKVSRINEEHQPQQPCPAEKTHSTESTVDEDTDY